MIEVTYYRNHNRLTVKGHALSDVPGRDLVCASCSALAYTLAANVGHMEDKGYVRDVTVKLEPGDCEIGCRPRGMSKAAHVRQIMEAVCMGFEMLAVSHPQYISYEIHG
jgi:uncharacterized protein YsxB (DUF464 family)